MKVTIDIDCTPEEARRFFGLPDVAPMQEELLGELKDHLSKSMGAMSPEEMIKMWMTSGFQGMDQLQKAFWAQAGKAKGGGAKKGG